MAAFIQKLRDLWRATTGQPTARGLARSEVVVHDPDSQRPHDLDDPFFDQPVQSRMAAVIADNTTKTNK
jgi:hypothetical protein